jgi:hypothetical protein
LQRNIIIYLRDRWNSTTRISRSCTNLSSIMGEEHRRVKYLKNIRAAEQSLMLIGIPHTHSKKFKDIMQKEITFSSELRWTQGVNLLISGIVVFVS